MSKSRRHKKSRKFRKSRKNRTRRHYKRAFSAGGPTTPISPNSNIPCCMCDREFPRESMMVPVLCLKQNRERAHRICEECWWDPEIGFARENAPHGCPGCKRGLPLNPPLKSRKPPTDEIIVLSDSD